MNSAAEAAGPFTAGQIVLGVGVLAGIGVAIASAGMTPIGRRRTVYWSGWAGTAVCGALSFADQGPGRMLAVGLVLLLGPALHAYRSGPSIRIGGRVFSYLPETADGTPITGRAGHYHGGVLSPAKHWWGMTVLTSFVAYLITQRGWDFTTLFGSGFVTMAFYATGTMDAQDRQPPTRGQVIPAFVVLVASIFSYGAPAVGYLVGYTRGKRPPASGGPSPTRSAARPEPRRSPGRHRR